MLMSLAKPGTFEDVVANRCAHVLLLPDLVLELLQTRGHDGCDEERDEDVLVGVAGNIDS